MTEADAIERLEAMRAQLDRIDAELMELLGRRFRTIRKVAEHKRLTGISVMQPSRVAEVFATRLQQARKAGLDPKLVERLWTTIITHACQVENQVGGIEGGELLFQGVSLDHARIEVDDLDAACEMICTRLSFSRVKPQGTEIQGRGAAILKGGDVTLLVSERAAPSAGDAPPACLAIQVHKLAPTVAELRRRGNSVEVRPGTGSGIGMASVCLVPPAHLEVHYVERAPGASPMPQDLDGRVLPAREDLGGKA
ncbi:chorismate mutase family protein [Paracoccus benzoatiresistens]|uniref:chorismate mutase n=1 Tax=Paracoccus benzoatiresistens TaxID=2997341 RepID=A0ABT4JAT1_9RHOB|nr:chorismate mutase family protein [Paracoccus sp. EF6]MCZ0963999.1 chorismate mutase family protein [Paracoccus sp. EF6]